MEHRKENFTLDLCRPGMLCNRATVVCFLVDCHLLLLLRRRRRPRLGVALATMRQCKLLMLWSCYALLLGFLHSRADRLQWATN
jgi:hypothetical protein